MVPTETAEDLLEKKVKEIIDKEIQKIGFEDLCRRYMGTYLDHI